MEKKTLWILRHAKSDWGTHELTDFSRPINARGHLDARAMGVWSYEQKIQPDFVLCSPAVRAKMTADVYLNELEFKMTNLHYDDSIYEARVSDLLVALQQLPDTAKSAVLIGHNPGLEGIVSLLVNDAFLLPSQGVGFMKTMALIELEILGSWSGLAQDSATFKQCMKPKSLSGAYYNLDDDYVDTGAF